MSTSQQRLLISCGGKSLLLYIKENVISAAKYQKIYCCNILERKWKTIENTIQVIQKFKMKFTYIYAAEYIGKCGGYVMHIYISNS